MHVIWSAKILFLVVKLKIEAYSTFSFFHYPRNIPNNAIFAIFFNFLTDIITIIVNCSQEAIFTRLQSLMIWYLYCYPTQPTTILPTTSHLESPFSVIGYESFVYGHSSPIWERWGRKKSMAFSLWSIVR